MPTVRKIPPPADEPSSPVSLSFQQAANLLRSRGYTVTGDGGSMFLVAREQPAEQRLLDKPGVIAKALAEREAQIADDAVALSAQPAEPALTADDRTLQLIDLEVIDDNPYQPRLVYDEERIAAIAASIKEHGLLQVPLARQLGDRYQLAFGHSRLRAYRQLAATDRVRFGQMPLSIRALDDETLALHAWIENRDRKDLSPYEEARAIDRYTRAFGWTQKAAAAKLQLSQPTIANKLRLLKLPESVLTQLRDGQISERQAAALLPLVELPNGGGGKKVWVGSGGIGYVERPADLYAKASALDSATLRSTVDSYLNQITVALAAKPWRGAAWEIAGVQAARCADCPIRLKATDRCPDLACASVKESAWRAQQAAAGAAAVGLPATHHRAYNERDDLSGVQLDALRTLATERGCGNLAVVFDDSRSYYPHEVKGFKHCWVVCGHGPGKRCGCKQALARRADPTTGMEAKKRHDRARIRQELMGPAEQAVTAALAQPTAAVWRQLFEAINSHAASKVEAGADIATIQAALASCLVANTVSYHLDYGYYDSSRAALARLLRGLNTPVPWEAAPDQDICAQIPTDGTPAPSSGDVASPLAEIAATLAGVERALRRALPPADVREYAELLDRLMEDLEAQADAPDVSDAAYDALATRIGDAQRQLAERLVVESEVAA